MMKKFFRRAMFVLVGLLIFCPTIVHVHAHEETKTTESMTQVQSEESSAQEKSQDPKDPSDIICRMIILFLVALVLLSFLGALIDSTTDS